MTNPIVMNKWSKIKGKIIKNTTENELSEKSDSDEQVIKDQDQFYKNTFENKIKKESNSDEQMKSRKIWLNPHLKINSVKNKKKMMNI